MEGWNSALLFRMSSCLTTARNVILSEEMKRQEDEEKIILPDHVSSRRNGTTFLYDFSMVCFKRKQRYLWLMMNGQPDYVWEHREKLDEFIRDAVCTAADVQELQSVSNEASLAVQVAEALGFEYQICLRRPPERH